ncbi:ATP-dependent RNA helicase RhlE [Syntrophotalea carbinolica DSM 2380]|uniref:ATP-dependent RNA helicase RhlE n=1 Tax=Syntrophotalea carbinolica (strain DSM 2380 / NBRC 103641 / GraBd1) TaxID=338963 RepID=Q3A7L6_SYNC1|nr:DEAD/DEAH box helicase [Syntrophotalea carbinolica]ABA87628.1 ATP-dependent RNA helicase RhlE [Syntrophotalea carbinolica DSM 2380]
MDFSELKLDPRILKALTDCGYHVPTPIQAQAVPEALAGRDLIASAGTGTGKTAAFMLPALQRLTVKIARRKGAPRMLVLAPTRELAGQVMDAARVYGKYLGLTTAVLLGGVPYRDQFRALAKPLDLVVATPGRLLDHLQRRSIDLSCLEMLVLDEADRMLDMGFKEDVDKVCAAAPRQRQTMMFTATLNDAMQKMARRLLDDPFRIDIAVVKNVSDHIEQHLHVADNRQHKNRLLQHLLKHSDISQAIVFSATKRDADSLARDLSAQGYRAAALHGDMNQGARNRTVRDLRRGRIRVLVATDVAARGLDVAGISHVFNYDLPKFAEDYVHRIGRTGRAGATGVAISFVSGAEVSALRRIQHFIGRELPRREIPGLEPRFPLRAASAEGRRRYKGNGPNRSGRKPASYFSGRKERQGGCSERSRGQSAARERLGTV